MDMITVSAKTLDEAITKALISLQTTSEHLHYEVTEKGSSGLLGMFSKPCIIKARVKTEEEELAAKKAIELEEAKKEIARKEQEALKEASRKQEELKAQEQVKTSEKKEEKPVNTEQKEKAATALKVDAEFVQAKAKEFLLQVFGAMGMTVVIETAFDAKESELQVMMSGEDMGILIGKRGQTLDSLQYLVSLVVNKETEGYLRVKLDTENYRERRKETLESLAKNISYKVKRTKRSVSLEPMNPYERRIIHSALQNDRYVTTRSEGEDPYRHVVISLKKEGYANKKDRYPSRRKDSPAEKPVELSSNTSVDAPTEE